MQGDDRGIYGPQGAELARELGPNEYVIEGNGAQTAVTDEIDELTVYVGYRQMIEVADHNVLGPEVRFPPS